MKSRGMFALSVVVFAIGASAAEIRGVVTGPKGPEAGVWVIAETTDLPTKFAKVVVTDDRGRYLIPELPQANYSVWVRGYGLVDSRKVKSAAGQTLNLKAVGAAHAGGAGHDEHGDRVGIHGPRSSVEALCRLDRPHRRRRAAVREAGAPARHRAQRGHHDVGLVDEQGLSARLDRDRQGQSHGQR